MLRVGVLAMQGAFAEHARMLHQVGAEPVEVRKPEHLEGLDGLIIPGGESTAISRLIVSSGLREPLRDFINNYPTWGTCAGAILLAKQVQGETSHLSIMDISIQRNAFGRQIDSFVRPLMIKGVEGPRFDAVFIRAPIITKVGSEVDVLAQLEDGRVVAVQQGHLLATSFHPELTQDDRLHRYFVSMTGLTKFAGRSTE